MRPCDEERGDLEGRDGWQHRRRCPHPGQQIMVWLIELEFSVFTVNLHSIDVSKLRVLIEPQEGDFPINQSF